MTGVQTCALPICLILSSSAILSTPIKCAFRSSPFAVLYFFVIADAAAKEIGPPSLPVKLIIVVIFSWPPR